MVFLFFSTFSFILSTVFSNLRCLYEPSFSSNFLISNLILSFLASPIWIIGEAIFNSSKISKTVSLSPPYTAVAVKAKVGKLYFLNFFIFVHNFLLRGNLF